MTPINNKTTITDSQEISRIFTRYQNIDENEIIITESKLENILLKHSEALKAGSDWKTPFGLIIAIITVFLTAEFNKDLFGLKSYEWKVFFFIILLISLGWITKSMYLRWKYRKENLENLIRLIKNEGKESEHQSRKRRETNLKIIKAIYGIEEDGKNVDVTSKLNDLIKENRLNVMANNALVNSDPAPGIVKYLDIQFEYNGEKLSKNITENSPVILPDN